MANNIDDISNPLQNLTYKNIISEIINENKIKKGIFVNGNKVGGLSILAYRVVEKLKEKDLDEIIGLNLHKNLTATLNFSNIKEEEEALKLLTLELESELSKLSPIPTFLKYHQDRTHFKGRVENLGVAYDFRSLSTNIASMLDEGNLDIQNSLLREDTVTISHDNTNMREDIKKSLIEFYTSEIDDDGEREYVIKKLEDTSFLVEKIEKFIKSFKYGCLKRNVEGPLFLDFVNDIVDDLLPKFNTGEKKAANLFKNYANRFKNLEKFVQDSLLTTSIDEYEMEYDDNKIDLIQKIRMESIYEYLPFVGKMTKVLLDTRDSDRHKGREVYGISLKRNGKVATDGKDSSFLYQFELLRDVVNGKAEICLDGRKKYKIGKEFVKALLFKYFLINLEDEDYDAVKELKLDIQKYKRNPLSNEKFIKAAIKELLTPIKNNKDSIMKNLDEIKVLLSKCIDENPKNYEKTFTKKLSVLCSILPEDIDSPETGDINIGKVNGYNTHLVKYTSLLDEDIDKDYYVYSYEYEIKITSKSIYKKEDISKLNISYLQEQYMNVNFIFEPREPNKNPNKKLVETVQRAVSRLEEETQAIIIRHEERPLNKNANPNIYLDYMEIESVLTTDKMKYIYQTAYTILATTIVSYYMNKISQEISEFKREAYSKIVDEKIIRKKKRADNKCLYVNIKQLTYKTENTEYTEAQTFVRELRKSLEHTLSVKYTAKSQGFNVNSKDKTANALASQYSKLPRVCSLKSPLKVLDKVAIILVTSRMHDSEFCEDYYKTLVHGEVILINKYKSNENVSVTNFEEFNQTLESNEIHKNPVILKDIVDKLYDLDYRNFIYMAKTPHTADLVEQSEKTQMYFMNEEVIETMVGNYNDINLYPMYINSFSIHKSNSYGKNNDDSTVYISNSEAITKEVREDYEGIFPLFQFFSGAVVDESNKDNFYRQMILYSSIKGIYSDDIIKKCKMDRLYKNKELVEDISNCFISLHLSRYEKASIARDYTTNIKNNPYENLLDDLGIGKITLKKYNIDTGKQNKVCLTMSRFALIAHITNALIKK